MLTKTDTLDKFGAAMAKAQEAICGAIKGNVNPHFKSKYADLSAVWEAWQAVGPSNGLSVMQFPGHYDTEKRVMAMDQLVLHASGQWIQSELTIPISKADAQAYGSATTYARRYALAAAVGVCPEDDDGNAASQRAPQEVPRQQSEPVIDDAQRAELMTLGDQAGADLKAFCTYYKIGSVAELPASRFAHARAMLAKKLSEKTQVEEAA